MLYLNQGLGLFPLHSCHLGPHLGLLLYGYLFPENSGTRRLGKDSAKHAVKPKPRSWNRHLHGGSSQTPLALCSVPRDPTSQTHRSWAWPPDVMRWYRVRILGDIKVTVPMQMLLDTVNVSLSLFSPVLTSSLSCMCSLCQCTALRAVASVAQNKCPNIWLLPWSHHCQM